VIGPYASHPEIASRTAFVILKDADYKELQKLAALYKKEGDKVERYLPSNVRYDAAVDALTHTFAGGTTQVTNLSALQIAEVDLTDEANWQL
jgi:hypothetical protein